MTKPRASKAAKAAKPVKAVTIDDQLIAIALRYKVPHPRVVEEWLERASIREYLGAMSREEAERAALEDVVDVIKEIQA